MELIANQDFRDILDIVHIINYNGEVYNINRALSKIAKLLNAKSAVFFPSDSEHREIDNNKIIGFGINYEYWNLFPRYYQIDPLVPALFSKVITCTIEDVMSHSRWLNNTFYKVFCRPQNIYHKMVVYLRNRNKVYGVIGLTRSEEQPNFSSREKLICRILVPHLVTSIYNNSLYSKILTNRHPIVWGNDYFAEGIIVINHNLQVVYCNQKAKEYCLPLSLKKLGRVSEEEDKGISVLPEILDDCAATKNIFENDRATRPTYIQRIIKRNRLEWLRVKTSIIWQPDGLISYPSFLVSLMSLSEIPKTTNKFMSIKHQLTKREMEIIDCILNGLSNEQIGKQLFISRNTVETHLKNIFKKTGVNNRLSLYNLGQEIFW